MIQDRLRVSIAVIGAAVLLTACGGSARPTPGPEPETITAGDSTAAVPEVPEGVAVVPEASIPVAEPAGGASETMVDVGMFTSPKDAPFIPGQLTIRGIWDFIVLFRGEPFSGILQLPASTQGTRGRLTLPGHFDGVITITSVEPQNGNVAFSVETPRGTAVFKGRFENSTTLAGMLEQVKVGSPGSSAPLRTLDETAIFSATRR